jgi:hypothetical protein
MNKLILIAFTFIIASCDNKNGYNRNEIEKLIKSDDPSDLVNGYFQIGEHQDTTFLLQLTKDMYDPRVTHEVKFKGMSVYQSKMIALKKISDLKPPAEISYKPDSAIVNFYCSWLERRTMYKCSN